MITKSSLDSCLFPIARMVYAATRLGKAALNLRTEIFPHERDHPASNLPEVRGGGNPTLSCDAAIRSDKKNPA
jgi:hypothetical protein